MHTSLSGTYKGMIANFESLLDSFDTKILEIGQFQRNQQSTPKTKVTSHLNMLKMERAKIKQIISDMNIMTEAQVLDLKENYSEDYSKAVTVLETGHS